MLKVLTGRIICVVTILLMVAGYTFSMGSIDQKRTTSLSLKKQISYLTSTQDIEEYNYLEIEEVEDFEDFEDVITFFDSFLFYKKNISIVNVLVGKHSTSSKTKIDSFNRKKEFDTPKWIYLKKIII